MAAASTTHSPRPPTPAPASVFVPMDNIEGGGTWRIKAYDIATHIGYLKGLKEFVGNRSLGTFMDSTTGWVKPEGPKVEVAVVRFNNNKHNIIMANTPRPEDVPTAALTTMYGHDKNADWDVIWIELPSAAELDVHLGMLKDILVQYGIKRSNVIVNDILVHNSASDMKFNQCVKKEEASRCCYYCYAQSECSRVLPLLLPVLMRPSQLLLLLLLLQRRPNTPHSPFRLLLLLLLLTPRLAASRTGT